MFMSGYGLRTSDGVASIPAPVKCPTTDTGLCTATACTANPTIPTTAATTVAATTAVTSAAAATTAVATAATSTTTVTTTTAALAALTTSAATFRPAVIAGHKHTTAAGNDADAGHTHQWGYVLVTTTQAVSVDFSREVMGSTACVELVTAASDLCKRSQPSNRHRRGGKRDRACWQLVEFGLHPANAHPRRHEKHTVL